MASFESQSFNIAHACLTRHATSVHADKTAMVFVDENLGAQSLTYRELDNLTARFCASLRSRRIAAGDRIVLRLSNTQYFPIAFFGALRAGVLPVATSPLLTASEFEFIYKHCGARACITERKLFDTLSGMSLGSDALLYMAGGARSGMEISIEDELANVNPQDDIYSSQADDPAYFVYTSGTTGYPKGVVHAHRSLLGRTSAAENWFRFTATSDDRILHSGKFNWTYVLGTGMMDPLYHGKSVIVYEGENSAERWVELLRIFQCDTFIAVPTIFRQILQKTTASKKDIPLLEHAMCAGEQLSENVLGEWIRRFGFPIYEGLGMSECSYYISQRPHEKIKPGSAGKIQPGRHIAVLDENQIAVAPGVEGMICIHRDDPGLMLGYWNSDTSSYEKLRGDWFLTGDYATVDAEGYLFFMGRRDDIIKSFGYRVSPFEIERVYRDHAQIADVVAFAETIDRDKTLIALCVQPKARETVDAQQLMDWGKERLSSYKLPRKVYTLAEFPRSANGKVLRSQIPRRLGLLK